MVVDDVRGTGIAEDLCQVVPATHGMPVAIMHLNTQYRRPVCRFEV